MRAPFTQGDAADHAYQDAADHAYQLWQRFHEQGEWGDIMFTDDDNRRMFSLTPTPEVTAAPGRPAMPATPGIGDDLLALEQVLLPLLPSKSRWQKWQLVAANLIDSVSGQPIDQKPHTDIKPLRPQIRTHWVIHTMLMNVRAQRNLVRAASKLLLVEGQPVSVPNGHYAWFSPTGALPPVAPLPCNAPTLVRTTHRNTARWGRRAWHTPACRVGPEEGLCQRKPRHAAEGILPSQFGRAGCQERLGVT